MYYKAEEPDFGMSADKRSAAILGPGGEAYPLVTAAISPGGGIALQAGAGGNFTLDKHYDQYGRPDRGDSYAIPGFAGSQVIDLAATTRTHANGAADDYSRVMGQKVNIKLPYNATGAYTDLTNFGGAGGKAIISDTDVLTLEVYRPESDAPPTMLNVFFMNTAGDYDNVLQTYVMVEARGHQKIAIPMINARRLGTYNHAADLGQVRVRMIHVTTKQCEPLRNSADDYVLIGDIRKSVRTRAKLLFTIDDGYLTDYTQWLPKLAEYGWTGTTYIVPTIIGLPGRMSVSQCQEMRAAGWCVGNHSWGHPMNSGANNGLRLLGPAGLVPLAVTGVNTTTGVFTVESKAPRTYGYGVIFSATTMPGGVEAGRVYYAGKSTATQFNIYATYADAVAEINPIIPTSAGSGVSLTYEGAESGSSAILSDIIRARDWLNSRNLDGEHFAYPQNGHDIFTYKAVMQAGFKTMRTAVDLPNYLSPILTGKQPLHIPGYMNSIYDGVVATPIAADALAPFGSSANLTACVGMTAGLTAEVKAAIDYAVAVGGTLCLLDHGYIGANVIAVCNYVKQLEMAGLLDVVNAREWYDGLSARM